MHDATVEREDMPESTVEEPLELLALLQEKRILRALDVQFSQFIDAQSNNQSLAFISAIVSAELGKGNSCIKLFNPDGEEQNLAQILGVNNELAQKINNYVSNIDWACVLQSSPLVSSDGNQPLPLVFDGERVYLQRYWHYEAVLANKLIAYSQPITLTPDSSTQLKSLLDQLFAREYRYLWPTLQQGDVNDRHWLAHTLIEHFSIVTTEGLGWQQIQDCVIRAKTPQELEALTTLIPDSHCINWQKVAAAAALTRRFAVISGGPGTGKTTTVTKLLVALIAQYQQQQITPIIKMVAPTGKAAARMTEQMAKAIQTLSISATIATGIPQQASTIHRLLGAKANSAEFKHNQHNLLHLDVLVVDEASMVDLPMMYKLFSALPSNARVILLGDKDQLASVDAGAVLGDICSFHQHGYSAQQKQLLSALTGFEVGLKGQDNRSQVLNDNNAIADSLCMLQKSFRFNADSGIGHLAKAVNQGNVTTARKIWQKGFSDIQHYSLDDQHYQQLIQLMVEEYQEYLSLAAQSKAQNIDSVLDLARKALAAFARCRLLCAVREGNFGVKGLNQRIETALAKQQQIQLQDELWYHGRPIMITRNDPNLGLFNGDIGICLISPYETQNSDGSRQTQLRLKVFFELPDGSIKSTLPSRVPDHETAYAMTIHKSQGSEFTHTVMVLPPDYTPILTRELIYTGITRAAKRFSLFANENVFNRSIKVTTQRASGLVSKLLVPKILNKS